MEIKYKPITYTGNNLLIKKVLEKSFDRYFSEVHRMFVAEPLPDDPFHNFHFGLASLLFNAACAIADAFHAQHYPDSFTLRASKPNFVSMFKELYPWEVDKHEFYNPKWEVIDPIYDIPVLLYDRFRNPLVHYGSLNPNSVPARHIRTFKITDDKINHLQSDLVIPPDRPTSDNLLELTNEG